MIRTIKDNISSNSYKLYPLKVVENSLYFFPYKFSYYSEYHLYYFFTKQVPPNFDVVMNASMESSKYFMSIPKTLQSSVLNIYEYVADKSEDLNLVILNTNPVSVDFYFVFYYTSYRS